MADDEFIHKFLLKEAAYPCLRLCVADCSLPYYYTDQYSWKITIKVSAILLIAQPDVVGQYQTDR